MSANSKQMSRGAFRAAAVYKVKSLCLDVARPHLHALLSSP